MRAHAMRRGYAQHHMIDEGGAVSKGEEETTAVQELQSPQVSFPQIVSFESIIVLMTMMTIIILIITVIMTFLKGTCSVSGWEEHCCG